MKPHEKTYTDSLNDENFQLTSSVVVLAHVDYAVEFQQRFRWSECVVMKIRQGVRSSSNRPGQVGHKKFFVANWRLERKLESTNC